METADQPTWDPSKFGWYEELILLFGIIFMNETWPQMEQNI